MVIHVVQPGDTLYSIALQYGIPMSLLMETNDLNGSLQLAVGQALVVRIPRITHTVQQGDTLLSIAQKHGLSLRQLYRNNPILNGFPELWPGQTLIISYQEEPEQTAEFNGYAYPFIDLGLLRQVLPYLTWLTPFTYGFTPDGTLIIPEDGILLSMARDYSVSPLMHLSTLTQEGSFSSELASNLLHDPSAQQALIENVISNITQKNYGGLDVDFEFLPAEDALLYVEFLRQLKNRLSPLNLPLITALAPKTYADQPGLLYEGHNYAQIGSVSDAVLLMTYEWGYTYSSPMAVAPLPNVRRVLEYALTEIPAGKIFLGLPAYGYDWPLPYVKGETRATSISCRHAVKLAAKYSVEIQYDAYSQSPWFRYRSESGQLHEVWFEDARSIQAKLSLIQEYGLRGAGYWNLMRPFPENWQVVNAAFRVLPN